MTATGRIFFEGLERGFWNYEEIKNIFLIFWQLLEGLRRLYIPLF